MTAPARPAEDDVGFSYDVLARPRRDRPARELPTLLARAVRLVHDAAPRELRLSLALSLGGGLLAGVQLLLLRRLLGRLLADGTPLSAIGPTVAGLVVSLVASGVALTWARERQRVLGELVVRHAQSIVARAACAADLVDFQRPSFHNRLQRALANLSSRPLTVTTGVSSLVGATAAAAGVTAALAAVEPALLAFVVVAGLPLWVAGRALGRSTFGFDVVQTEADRRRSYLLSLLVMKGPAQEVRAYNTAEHLQRALAGLWDERLLTLRALARRRALTGSLARIVSGTLVGALLLFLGWLVTSGRLTLAEAGVAASAALLLANALQSITGAIGMLYESALFLEDAEAFIGPAAGTGAGAAVVADRKTVPFERLDLRHVCFRYPGASSDALDDVSFTIRAGEVVALVGVNGSGKSTLAKVLAQLYVPTAGRVTWNGTPVVDGDRATRRDDIAVLFQDFDRFLFSAAENIGLGRVDAMADTDRIRRAATAAGSADRLARMPNGFDSLLGPEFFGGTDLSGGEWQRIALARAFFRQAPLLVLDEPTSAMDPEAEHELFARLRELWAGRAVVLVSHRFSNVTTADRIVVLDRGRIVEEGTHDALMAQGGRYATMFRTQAEPYQLSSSYGSAT